MVVSVNTFEEKIVRLYLEISKVWLVLETKTRIWFYPLSEYYLSSEQSQGEQSQPCFILTQPKPANLLNSYPEVHSKSIRLNLYYVLHRKVIERATIQQDTFGSFVVKKLYKHLLTPAHRPKPVFN